MKSIHWFQVVSGMPASYRARTRHRETQSYAPAIFFCAAQAPATLPDVPCRPVRAREREEYRHATVANCCKISILNNMLAAADLSLRPQFVKSCAALLHGASCNVEI